MRKLFAFISVLFVLPLAAQDAGAVRQLQKLTQVYRYLNGLYVDEVDMQPLVESAITGMLEDLDPHSAYIGADEMKGVQESFEGEFSGPVIEACFCTPYPLTITPGTIPFNAWSIDIVPCVTK